VTSSIDDASELSGVEQGVEVEHVDEDEDLREVAPSLWLAVEVPTPESKTNEDDESESVSPHPFNWSPNPGGR
jgi:hypothetical protein